MSFVFEEAETWAIERASTHLTFKGDFFLTTRCDPMEIQTSYDQISLDLRDAIE
jgi:hypothetical protein